MNKTESTGTYRAVVGLGSNTQGNRATNLMGGRVAEVSNFYETQPYGPNSGTLPYINAVAIIETSLKAEEIESELKEIENDGGRDRTDVNHLITIDIDLVMWNGIILRPHEIDRDYFARGWKEIKQYV